MDPQRIDFTPVDATADRARFEAMVGAIMRLAAPELARRAAGTGPIFLIAEWARPMLAAAATVAALSAGLLTLAERSAEEPAMPAPGVAESLRLPPHVAAWLAEDRAPSVSDLLLALDNGGTP